MSGRPARVVVVPGVLALLPSYRGIEDPVADLRAACLEAVRWLGPEPRVVASAQGARVAAYLLGEVPSRPAPHPADGVLVVGNGSAKRSERAPGYLDERAAAFDDDVRDALLTDASRLADLDRDLARELWADVDGLIRLGRELEVDPASVRVDYDDDPYGVQYWVLRMEGAWR